MLVTSHTSKDPTVEETVTVTIEKKGRRQRQVLANVHIPYTVEQVWQVLTDYESFAQFIPTLTQCSRLESPTGGIRIQETRTNQLMGIKIKASTIFDIKEQFLDSIHYQLVQGDMKEFSGYWYLKPLNLSESKQGTDLIFDFFVVPKCIFPMMLIEHMINQNVSANLQAIRQRVEDSFGSDN